MKIKAVTNFINSLRTWVKSKMNPDREDIEAITNLAAFAAANINKLKSTTVNNSAPNLFKRVIDPNATVKKAIADIRNAPQLSAIVQQPAQQPAPQVEAPTATTKVEVKRVVQLFEEPTKEDNKQSAKYQEFDFINQIIPKTGTIADQFRSIESRISSIDNRLVSIERSIQQIINLLTKSKRKTDML